MVIMCFKKITDCLLCVCNLIFCIIFSGILIAKYYKLPEVKDINETYISIALAIFLFLNFIYCMIYKYVCKT